MKNLEVEIIDLDHFGRGIAKTDKPIFVENSLIGEVVKIKITKEKKKYLEAQVIKFIKTSPYRVNSKCPYYDKCGGCDLLHMDYHEQLKYKEKKVREIIKKFSGLECVKKIVPSVQFNYRNKVTLHVNKKIGYYQRKSYEIVAIGNCLIADVKINNLIERFQKCNLDGINKIVIRVTDKESMLIFDGGRIDISKFKDVDTIIVDNKILTGRGYIKEQIGKLKFVISPTSFFQVNKVGMINIYNKVLEYVDKDSNVLDLYCGTGTIGIYVCNKVKEVLGIEINEEAIADALVNKKLNNLSNINFKAGDVGKILSDNKFKVDNVIVDPPRSGLDENAIKNIIQIEPQKIIYVSCDPVTLARDLNILKQNYKVVEITPFDMFCKTYHVECVALLEK